MTGPAVASRPGAGVRHVSRVLRVGLLGGGSLLLATAAHLSGGGTLPAPGVLVVAAFVLGLVALLLTRRRLRLPVLLATLVPQQVLLHVFFDTAAAAAGGCTTVQAAHHAMSVLTCMPTHGMGPMGYAWPMFLGHAVATLGTAWLLARGEAWCLALVERAARAAYVVPASRPGRRRPRPLTAALPRRLVLRPHRPRPARGPPPAFA